MKAQKPKKAAAEDESEDEPINTDERAESSETAEDAVAALFDPEPEAVTTRKAK